MMGRLVASLAVMMLVAGSMALSAAGGDWPFRHKAKPEAPNSMVQVARSIDDIEDKIRDDGTIVIKQPDVWGQARMTKYRLEFESAITPTMKNGQDGFAETLQAVISRSDQASFQSESALAAVLTPVVDSNGRRTRITTSPADATTTLNNLTTSVNTSLGLLPGLRPGTTTPATTTPGATTPATTTPGTTAPATANPPSLPGLPTPFNALNSTAGLFDETLQRRDANGLIAPRRLGIGLEPTIVLDQHKRYLDHLNEIRRVNIGDDTSDSAGYGLYLFRLPVSLQPGEKTVKGHGAQLTLTARPEFGPMFLPDTYRSLVINDIVDQLAPVIYELVRSFDRWDRSYREFEEAYRIKRRILYWRERDLRGLRPTTEWEIRSRAKYIVLGRLADEERREAGVDVYTDEPVETDETLMTAERPGQPRGSRSERIDRLIAGLPDEDKMALEREASSVRPVQAGGVGSNLTGAKLVEQESAITDATYRSGSALKSNLATLKVTSLSLPSSRSDRKPYPIAPTDLSNVFLAENLYRIAYATRNGLQTKNPRVADIRAFMRHQLGSAYDLMAGSRAAIGPLSDVAIVDEIAAKIEGRLFEGPKGLFPGDLPRVSNERVWLEGNQLISSRDEAVPLAPYQRLMDALPGNVEQRSLGALCWAIAVEAGVLNRELRDDIRRHSGRDGIECPSDLESLHFYLPATHGPVPDPAFAAADLAFKQYVAKRWKIVTFALDPVTDQQNLGDSFSRVRDLQLSLAVAFAAGNINFQQFNRFRRQLQYEASTIALNRTVTAFAHGDDTFGWRFAPRFQTPPEERNNLRVAVNTIVRNGPGRNYQANNSKLEAGQRELTAVVIMPSFLQQVRFDVEGSWWRLHDPDEVKPHTVHKLEQGRKVIELQQAVATVCDSGQYRRDDLERLMTKVHQLEEMLPFQTRIVQVPYGNALGGFDLFSPGSTSLEPELVAFQGVDQIIKGETSEVFLFAKNLNLQETRVVVGGKRVRHNAQDVVDAQGDVGVREAEFEILSREIVRVTIPGDVQPTTLRDTGERVVEVYLATPNGISNRLTIPYVDATPAAGVYDWRVLDPAVTIAYKVKQPAGGEPVLEFFAQESSPRLRIALDWAGPIVPAEIEAAFDFLMPSQYHIGPFSLKAPRAGGVYSVPIDAFANTLRDQATVRKLVPNEGPVPSVVAQTVKATPVIVSADLAAVGKETTNALTVNFKFFLSGTVDPVGLEAAPGPEPAKPDGPVGIEAAPGPGPFQQDLPPPPAPEAPVDAPKAKSRPDGESSDLPPAASAPRRPATATARAASPAAVRAAPATPTGTRRVVTPARDPAPRATTRPGGR